MAQVIIEFEGDNQTESSFNRIMSDIDDLRVDSGRATDSMISDSSRLSRLQIQDAERSVRQRTSLIIRANRDIQASELRNVRNNADLTREQMRVQVRAIQARTRVNILAAETERNLNLERLRNARISIQTIAAEERRLEQQRTRANRAFLNQLRTIGRRLRTISTLVGSFGGIGVIDAFRFAIDAATQIDTLRNSFVALGLDVAGANRELEEARRLARLPGISLEGAGRALVDLRSINVVGARAVGLVTQLGNALALTGGTDLSGLVRAFTQIAGRGEVLQEEINQIVERAPILRRALTEAFGTASAEGIRDALANSENQVTAFFDRLTTAAGEIGRAPVTGAANTFQNFRIAVRDLAAAIGQLALPRLTQQIRDLTRSIETNSQQIANRFQRAIDLMIAGIDRLINNFRNLTNFLGAGLVARVLFDISQASTSLNTSMFALGSTIGQVGNGLNTFSSIASGIVRTFTILSGIGTAVAAVFAGIELINFIRGTNDASDSVRRLTDDLNIMGQAALDANANLSLIGLTRRLQLLQASSMDVSDEFQRLRRELRFPQATTLQQLQEEILRRRDITSQLGGNVNLLRMQDSQLRELNNLLETQRALDANISDIRSRITETTSEENQVKADTVDITQQQLGAEDDLFSHRLRLLGLENRLAQVRREQASEQDLQFQERVAARQTAIAEDQARRAAVIRRQGVSAAIQASQEEREGQLQTIRNLGTNIVSIFRRVNISLVEDSRNAANAISNNFQEAANAFVDLQNRINAGVARLADAQQRAFDAAGRQTRDQQTIVDDLVGTDAESNLEARLRPFYDTYIRGREQAARTVEAISEREFNTQVQLTENLTDSVFELAFERERSFRDVATSFLRESLRILAQSALETQVLLANNARIVASNQAVATSRAQAFGLPGAGGLGNLALGGVGAVGGAGAIFPREFSNLFQGIGNVLRDVVDVISGAPGAIGTAPVFEINARFDDGTSRQIVTRGTQAQRNRR